MAICPDTTSGVEYKTVWKLFSTKILQPARRVRYHELELGRF